MSTSLLKMETKMDQLRALVEAADKEKVELLNQLEEERRYGLAECLPLVCMGTDTKTSTIPLTE